MQNLVKIHPTVDISIDNAHSNIALYLFEDDLLGILVVLIQVLE